MSKICTVKCPLCGNYFASFITKKKMPLLFCGVCRISIMILSRNGRDNFAKACQEIEDTELAKPTLEWYKKKIGGKAKVQEEEKEKS